ncbi:ADOP family duplicated permease [Dokdonella sp.]|uniref:ADOP family duplicated permease n=1 Tax=Dokdonella sp. TaxID=2291710 RepID=UPI0031C12D50|nr:ADOP family duplicated permease [Dokdonella sp.]
MNLPFAALRQSWRTALHRPAFLVLAASTLALGIGAAVAVFALVDAILLAPPPFPQPDRLVVVGKGDNLPWSTISPQQYQCLDDLPGIDSLGSHFAARDVNVSGGGDPELVSAWPTDAGLLPTLGVKLALGRNFTAEEDRPNGPRAAILGHALWQRQFGGAEDVIGRSMLVDGVATPIVGVLPATLRLDGAPDLLLPLALAPASQDGATNLLVIARLAPDANIDAVSAAIATRLATRLREIGFAYANLWPHFGATPLARNLNQTARPVLLLFLACAACVLLLVAVNLANLMLLRALARGHDSAVRAALGASRAQLASQALGEGALIGGLGALGGLGLAALALGLLAGRLPAGWLDPATPLIGLRDLAFALAAALIVALLAAAFGTWRGTSRSAVRELAAGTRMGTTVASQRFSRSLIVAQATLATLLLGASSLLAHSLWKLGQVDLGFDARGIITYRLNPATELYADTASVQRLVQNLLERLDEQPGVRGAAVTTTLPIGGQLNLPVQLPDGSTPPEPPQYRAVSAGAFDLFRIPSLSGRDFAPDDTAGTEPVAIVNQAFARQYLGGHAVGQSVSIALDAGGSIPNTTMRIVGVVGDVRQFGPQEASPPILYVPLAQVPDGLFNLLRRFVPLNVAVGVTGTPANWFTPLREILREVDPRQGMAALRRFERDVADATAPERMNALLVGILATLATLLASIGLYSVTAVAVASRRREFGVRAALGAAPTRLLGGVLGAGLRDVALGLAIGLGLVSAAAHLLERFLFGVGAFNPWAIAATLLVLLSASLAATLVPALRASRTAPMTALRND